MLTTEEKERYARNIIAANFSEEEQIKLKNAKILVVGAGGLGSALLNYLAAAGVGLIGIVEFDTVSVSNLQRQTLYNVPDLGFDKIFAAVSRLKLMNPEVNFGIHKTRFTSENGVQLLSDYDMIVDCSDNFETRIAIDAVAAKCCKPMVYGTAQDWGGQISSFLPGDARYVELYGSDMQQQKEVGVISPIVGIMGSMQGLEVIKLITGIGENLSGKLLVYNGLKNSIEIFKLA